MRKAWILAAVLAAAVSGSCSLRTVQGPEKAGGAPAQEEGASVGRKDDRKTALPEAGAAPYDFSEAERYVLESFGMYGRSNLFAFRGPQGAESLEVNVYRLNPDGVWEMIGVGGSSLGNGGYVINGDGSLEEAGGGEMDGVLALEMQEDHSIAFHINSLGRVSCETEPIALGTEIVGSAVRFLDEFAPMELGQELPVALMLYDSGRRMELPGLEDYFNGGWYFRNGEFCGPYHGVPLKDTLRSMISMYRFHDQDAITFQRSLRVCFRNPWEADRLKPFRYSSTAYYYLDKASRPPQQLPGKEALLALYRTRDTDHQSIP